MLDYLHKGSYSKRYNEFQKEVAELIGPVLH